MYIEKKLEHVGELTRYLEKSEGTTLEQEREKLEALEKIVGENPLVIQYKVISLYNAGYAKQAREYLKKALLKHEYNYDLHYLNFEILRYTEAYDETVYALSQMLRLASSRGKTEETLKWIEDYAQSIRLNNEEIKHFFEKIRRESESQDYRRYPLDEYGESTIRKNVFYKRDFEAEYITNLYKTLNDINLNDSNRYFLLYEMIKGKYVNKEVSLEVKEGDILAVSSAREESLLTKLRLENIEKGPIEINLPPNVIKYFKVKEDECAQIVSNEDIFVGHFKKRIVEKKPKLVMQLFLDGLSYSFLEKNGFQELMPNTYKFFREGYINTNCHATGEWTLPSLMSMSTGKYTTSHHVYHTNIAHKGEQNNKLIQEYFSEAGYMTGRICSNWRGTPSYGYFKGTDRSVYSPMIERMHVNETITETLEHLEAFKGFSNYVWVTIEDLHSVADGLTKGPFQDMNVDQYRNENVKNDSTISVFRNYNEKKIEEYKATIKRIDFYLGILFDYLLKNYSEEEFLVTINSDHGQRFIEKQDYMFSESRTNVPFMMRGAGVLKQKSNELMSNVDIVPTVLNICKLECEKNIDGQLLKDFEGEKRKYSITESIFPGQTYKLAINDNQHLFKFETQQEVREGGLISIQEYTVELINKETGKSEVAGYPEKVKEYLKVTFEHVREWIDIPRGK